MPSTINASTTSTTGLVQTADASGILQLQSDGTTGLTVNANANVTVNTNLFVSGSSVQPLVSGTAQNTTSGTAIDFTGIPSWVKRITLMLSGVSTSAASNWLVQLGTASGIENTGYLGAGTFAGGAAPGSVQGSSYTAGFGLLIGGTGLHVMHGTIILSQLSSSANTWTCSGQLGGTSDGANYIYSTAGAKSLSGVLTQVRLTTVSGTPTFDAGTVNILYE